MKAIYLLTAAENEINSALIHTRNPNSFSALAVGNGIPVLTK